MADAHTGIRCGRDVGEPRQEIIGTLVLTMATHRAGGDIGEVVQTYVDALRKARNLDFVHGEIPLLIHLAEAQRDAARPVRRIATCRTVAEASTRRRHTHHAADRPCRDRAVSPGVRCSARAREALDEALHLATSSGQRLVQANALHTYGHLAATSGDTDIAAEQWRTAHKIFTALGAPEAGELQELLAAH